LVPKLSGKWLCDIGADDNGDVYAVLACNAWKRQQFFTVLRQDEKLCLLASTWPPGSELLNVYASIEQLTDAISAMAANCDNTSRLS
jgi:hypothetical protein